MNTLFRYPFKKVLFIGVLCLGLVAVFSVSDAEKRLKKKSLRESLGQSEFAFRGRVESVKYKKSEDGTPHAFVRYKVREVFRGQVADRKKEITLRFIGGPMGNGSFLAVQGVPNFNPGDQDILFVRGNGSLECPLVDCEKGRFRIKNGGVFSSRGKPIQGIKEGKVKAHGKSDEKLAEIRYPAPSFDALIKRPEVQEKMKKMGKNKGELRQKYEREAPKQIVLKPGRIREGGEEDASKDAEKVGKKQKSEEPRTKPMKLEGFVNEIKKNKKGLKAPRKAVVSLDSKKGFKSKRPSPGAPKGDQHLKLKDLKMQPLTEQDKAEMEELKRQKFNPVLKSKPLQMKK